MKEQKIEIKNYTPHQINLAGETYPSMGSIRVSCETKKLEGFPFPVSISEFGRVQGLPKEQKDTIIIVSKMVAERLPSRKDLWIVNETIRNDKGQIVGAESLTHLHMDISDMHNYLHRCMCSNCTERQSSCFNESCEFYCKTCQGYGCYPRGKK